MNSTDKGKTENIVNLFDVAIKIYQETSFLLKDFSDLLKAKKFKGPSGNAIEMYGGFSRSLNWSNHWLVRCASLSFKPKVKAPDNRVIEITVVFCTDQKEDEPRLVVGALDTDGNPGWLYYACYNIDDNYQYHREGKEFKYCPTHEDIDEKMTNFVYKPDNKIRGCFFTVPLLSVKGYEDVEKLSERAVKELWTKLNNFE